MCVYIYIYTYVYTYLFVYISYNIECRYFQVLIHQMMSKVRGLALQLCKIPCPICFLVFLCLVEVSFRCNQDWRPDDSSAAAAGQRPRVSRSWTKVHRDLTRACAKKSPEIRFGTHIHLVGGWATPLKNICQLGWLFPIYGKITVMFQSPPTSHLLYFGFIWLWRTWLELKSHHPIGSVSFSLPAAGCPGSLQKTSLGHQRHRVRPSRGSWSCFSSSERSFHSLSAWTGPGFDPS